MAPKEPTLEDLIDSLRDDILPLQRESDYTPKEFCDKLKGTELEVASVDAMRLILDKKVDAGEFGKGERRRTRPPDHHPVMCYWQIADTREV